MDVLRGGSMGKSPRWRSGAKPHKNRPTRKQRAASDATANCFFCIMHVECVLAEQIG